MENVKNDAICHVTRQNQYNPAGGGATIIVMFLLLVGPQSIEMLSLQHDYCFLWISYNTSIIK